ncbi:membrane protein [Vibrio galatheae]|uniref:Membrane protein n=1 Tax=Vibrio galatheae TaxID=579748 RepID=A0A0F4NGB9_9VIBR|nr:MMPL family transporter [Vibrio galatheae]KJY81964.1 membrane protein [Vibrio galatheae]
MLNKHNSASNPARFIATITSKKLALAWLTLVLVFIAMLAKQWQWSAQSPIETNILKLLPVNKQNPVAEQAFEAVSGNLSDKVVFVVTANDERVFSAASQLAQSLTETGRFKQVVGKVSAKQQNQWAEYYFNHRFQQLTPEQRLRLEVNPQAQVQYVLQSLYNPFSGVTGKELTSDPFLLFRDYLNQLSQLSSAFTLEQGFLTTTFENRKYVLVSATLNDSPYNLNAQQGVAEIVAIEDSISEQFDAQMLHTGVLFYAQFGTESAKSEISTIGLFSLLGIVVLIVGVFRSAAPLSLALLSIGIGLLAALAMTTWIFGTVHLFSLVFGASLIGVSIDYAFHYLTERLAAGQQWDSRKGLKHIFAAITMGLVTSLIGYLGMLIAPFPGLQQLALFSSIGLIAAYATVVAWYPVLAIRPSADRPLPGQKIWHQWLMLWEKPRVRVGLPILSLAVALFPLANLHYDDDIRQLQAMPDNLKQQEQLINQLSGIQSSQQMLVVTAEDDEALMQRLESLETRLNTWQQQDKIQGYQSLSQYLGSFSRQEQDHQLIASLYANQAAQLQSNLKLTTLPSLNQLFTAVSVQDYLAHPVSEAVRFLYVGQVDKQVAAVVVLSGLNAVEEVRAFAAQQNDISYLDKAEEISILFADYRVKVMELLIGALTVIALLLAKRYGLKHAFKILIPSLIACVAGLAAATAVGSTLNLFNLLALILIVGIGIDYTLFFAEKARSHSTLLAITLSALTTLLSFGLLSLSQTHAIHSFGITVLSGIFVAWLLSPLAIEDRKQQ